MPRNAGMFRQVRSANPPHPNLSPKFHWGEREKTATAERRRQAFG
jgi:hypothetical protein